MALIFYSEYNHPTKLYFTENFPNCRDVAQAGFNKGGIFSITVPGKSERFEIYCDFETNGGDWLVSFVYILTDCQNKIQIKKKIKA